MKRYAWALSCLKKAGLRLTRPRQFILQSLVKHATPVSLDVLGKELRGKCNLVTIYRTVHFLQKIGVVRQVNLTTHHICVVLVAPGEHCDYLVCNHCGSVGDLPDAQPILELEKQLAIRSGFRAVQHEAVFYGLCRNCQPGSQNEP